MFKKLLNGIIEQRMTQKRAELYRNLIRHEARIGGQLFGPIPEGHRREFFCLDEHTWVWHEEWIDQNRQHQTKTTRYDVRPNGILKLQDGQYKQLSIDEAKHLRDAAHSYRQKIEHELYSFAV